MKTLRIEKIAYPFAGIAAAFLIAAAGCGGGSNGGGPSTTTTATSSTSTTANFVQMTTDANYRYVRSNGIPDHATGAFPNAHNPNTMTAQNYNFRMSLHPARAGGTTDVSFDRFGVAVNGVPFDPAANEFWNNDRNSGWRYEALGGGVDLGLDQNVAHVQPDGSYHYHGVPTGLVAKLNGNGKVVLLGYAADGFPIYGPYGYSVAADAHSAVRPLQSSYRLKIGTRPNGPGGTYDGTFVQDYEYVAGSGDLDECNGRIGPTPEFPGGTYYYVLSTNWPILPRYWRGARDASFGRGR